MKGSYDLDPQQTYLRFTVQNNDTTANTNCFNIDNLGTSFINRLDVFHASNLLETIQQYNVLMSYLFDFQFTYSAKNGLSTNYGTNGAATVPRQGAPVFANTTAGSGQRLTMCIPFLSSVFGLGADKMLPLGALSDDVRIELTWESQNAAVCYNATPNASWTIIQAEIEATIIELSDEGESMVQSVTPYSQPVFLHGNSWRHYMSNLPTTTVGGFSFLIPARFASLTGLVILPRSSAYNIATAYTISSRSNPNIQSYWFRVGAYLIPNKMITLQNSNSTGGYAEAFTQIIESFHSLTCPQYAAGIAMSNYQVQDAATDALTGGGTSATVGGVSTITAVDTTAHANLSYINAFALAQNLTTWANRSDILISGLNTLASQVYFEGNIQSTAVTSNYTIDAYANYDVIYVLENGILSAKY